MVLLSPRWRTGLSWIITVCVAFGISSCGVFNFMSKVLKIPSVGSYIRFTAVKVKLITPTYVNIFPRFSGDFLICQHQSTCCHNVESTFIQLYHVDLTSIHYKTNVMSLVFVLAHCILCHGFIYVCPASSPQLL